MAEPAPQLPSEVWLHVFGYLSFADKFSIRASCKYFKKVVDHGSLWKDWSVGLCFPKGSYNSQFWATLRRRKVSSVVVRSTSAKDWKQLALSLPALSTVVMDQSSQASLSCLKDFANLKRLAIRNSPTSLLLDASTVNQPQQVTHLSMCDVGFPTTAMNSFIAVISLFKNLTSLVCHGIRISAETIWVVRSILSHLPKLKHLSVSMLEETCPCSGFHLCPKLGGAVLSSLELIGCMESSLPDELMRQMPNLRSLAVFYKRPYVGMSPSDEAQLKTWLSDLPQLSTLAVTKGPPVRNYVTAIPATVTSLTLCVAGLSSEDMAAIAVQVPDLLHLHIDPWPLHLGAHTARIPQLFPKLRSLKLRHEHVPESDFLHLHQLQDLEYLEILDRRPHLSELTGKLQALTQHRLEVTTSPRRTDVMSCTCHMN